jgi:hypothetical protein
VSIKRTCTACPSQWEGRTDDGRDVYVRFRWGGLSVGIGDGLDNAIRNESYRWDDYDGLNGWMTYAELKTHFTDEIEWPASDGDDREDLWA